MTNKTEISALLVQVKEAATQLKDKISVLDDQIDALYLERAKIINMPLSKDDYLSAVRADVRGRAKIFKNHLTRNIKDGRKVDYQLLAAGAPLSIPYLSGGLGSHSFELQEGGYFYYLESAIVAGVERALEGEEWPIDSMPAAERKTALSAIDAKVSKLTVQRDGLADDLMSTGLTR